MFGRLPFGGSLSLTVFVCYIYSFLVIIQHQTKMDEKRNTSTWRHSTQSTKLIRSFRHLSLPTRFGCFKTQLCVCAVFRCCLRSYTIALALCFYVSHAVFALYSIPRLVVRCRSSYTHCLDFIQHSFYAYVCSLLHSLYPCVYVCRAVDAAGFEFDICIHALHTGRHTNTNVNINKERRESEK